MLRRLDIFLSFRLPSISGCAPPPPQQAAVVSPDDLSPWSASNGPWRAVGVRQQRLVFALPGASEGASKAGLEVNADCLADGGYDVELEGARFSVRGAELDAGGGMTAIVDGRRAGRALRGCCAFRGGKSRRLCILVGVPTRPPVIWVVDSSSSGQRQARSMRDGTSF